MASLIEELITVLTEETAIYEELVPIAEEKSQTIIDNDLPKLQAITDREQALVDRVTALERKRMGVITNIGYIVGKPAAQIKVNDIIHFLDKQPKEQKELSVLHDRLKHSIQTLIDINNRNRSLIQQSLEMIEFNMNFIQSTRMSPGNNNYNRGAMNQDSLNSQTRMFDAKQ